MDLTPTKIVCSVPPGMTINKAIARAVDISVEKKMDVEFEFNGETWEVPYVNILAMVQRLNAAKLKNDEAGKSDD